MFDQNHQGCFEATDVESGVPAKCGLVYLNYRNASLLVDDTSYARAEGNRWKW
jgi:hypothetical protein